MKKISKILTKVLGMDIVVDKTLGSNEWYLKRGKPKPEGKEDWYKNKDGRIRTVCCDSPILTECTQCEMCGREIDYIDSTWIDEISRQAQADMKAKILAEVEKQQQKYSPYERNHGMPAHSRDTLTNAYRKGYNQALVDSRVKIKKVS